MEGATITGPLTASGAAGIRVCNATITGPVTISGSSGLVMSGDDETPPWAAACAGSDLAGPVRITGNTAGVEFDGNTATGPLTITGNTGTLPPPDTGTVEATGSTVSGPVNIQH